MSVIEDHIRAIVRDELAKTGQAPASAPAEAPAPAKRGRGRPVAGESSSPATAAPAPAPAATVTVETDPFATPAPAAPPAPTATEADVRAALSALRAATTQDNALAVLKAAGGASNLTELKPEKYGAVVAAAQAAAVKAATAAQPPGKVYEDPFAAPVEQTAPAYTLEDVKRAVVEATKRTGADRAAKVVMDLGGTAAKPDGGFGPSWTALPKEQYAAAIAGLNALPTTK